MVDTLTPAHTDQRVTSPLMRPSSAVSRRADPEGDNPPPLDRWAGAPVNYHNGRYGSRDTLAMRVPVACTSLTT